MAARAIARRELTVVLLERRQPGRRAVKRLQPYKQNTDRAPWKCCPEGVSTASTPFHPASWEERRGLEQFRPPAVLMSCGPLRAPRRAPNEAALDTQH